MKTFELILNGFDGGTDENDNLVKWIGSDGEATVQEWIDHHNLRPHVNSVDDMDVANFTFADGVNVMLDDRGDPGRGDIEYKPGKWEVVVEGFDPKVWIYDSQQACCQREKAQQEPCTAE